MPFEKGKAVPGRKPFVKGKSGNPKGRPKKIPQLDELLAELLCTKQKGKTAAEALLLSVFNQAIKGNVQAANIILDRAYGKAKQTLEISNPDGEEFRFGYGPEKPV